jgi:periplasmic protein TonB
VREPLLRLSSPQQTSEDTLLRRISTNWREAFRPIPWKVTSANGAPIHLTEATYSPQTGRAQGMSFLTHAGVIALIVAFALRPTPHGESAASHRNRDFPPLLFPQRLLERSPAKDPNDPGGTGGNKALFPTTSGNLPTRSSIQLVKPSLPPPRESQIPIPPTILDPTAAPVLTPVDNIGLPWMKENNRSPGAGSSNTMGSRAGDNIGDGPSGPGGGGDSPGKRYGPGMIMPSCLYCPAPVYTDEARQTKLQGTVMLLVLVGVDGRAADMRITKGLGAGLDERAIETVRGWRFTPARDAARRSVATWVTIEVVFRLF